jgi:hypothetical protein
MLTFQLLIIFLLIVQLDPLLSMQMCMLEQSSRQLLKCGVLTRKDVYINNKIVITFSNVSKGQVVNWCSIMFIVLVVHIIFASL